MNSTAYFGKTIGASQPTQSHPLPIYSSKLIEKLESLTKILEGKKADLNHMKNNSEKLEHEISSLKQGISTMNGNLFPTTSI